MKKIESKKVTVIGDHFTSLKFPPNPIQRVFIFLESVVFCSGSQKSPIIPRSSTPTPNASLHVLYPSPFLSSTNKITTMNHFYFIFLIYTHSIPMCSCFFFFPSFHSTQSYVQEFLREWETLSFLGSKVMEHSTLL